ncbi:MAG: Hsp20/alpha crystallin family protein [Candidatus Aminicenantes bacterium]|nr:Hsp20/alpha crystallin family protein [Candidatus Aminicenantes bacterium]
MTLVRWKPYRELFNLQEKMNQMFRNDFLQDIDANELSMTSWSPLTDIFETKDEYVLRLEVPGMSKDDIQVEFNQDTLAIKGERKEEKEVKQEDFHRTERCCGTFTRSFNLPKNIDEKKIDASLKDGILELRIPKKEESKIKAIPIEIK